MKFKAGASFAAGGTAPLGAQATTGAVPGNPNGQGGLMGNVSNPRTMLFWLFALGVLFVFHVGGARLP